MTKGQRTIATAICIGAIGTVIFGAGFVASDVLSTKRLTVTNDAGKAVVLATADAAGNGELFVLDSDGKQIFAVRGGKVYGLPTGKPAATRSPTPGSAGRIMQLIRVYSLPPELRGSVEELRREADQLEENARYAESMTTAELGPKTDSTKDQRAQYRKLALQFRTEAKQKRAEAARLEQSLKHQSKRSTGGTARAT